MKHEAITRHRPAIRHRALGYRCVQILRFVHDYAGEHGFAPSYATIGDHLGMDEAHVCRSVAVLEKRALLMRAGKGKIRRGRGDTRGTIRLC